MIATEPSGRGATIHRAYALARLLLEAEAGLTYDEIAERLGVSLRTAFRYVNAGERAGLFGRRRTASGGLSRVVLLDPRLEGAA